MLRTKIYNYEQKPEKFTNCEKNTYFNTKLTYALLILLNAGR